MRRITVKVNVCSSSIPTFVFTVNAYISSTNLAFKKTCTIVCKCATNKNKQSTNQLVQSQSPLIHSHLFYSCCFFTKNSLRLSSIFLCTGCALARNRCVTTTRGPVKDVESINTVPLSFLLL